MYQLYFGTRGYERWVKLPRPGAQRGLFGWSSTASHVGGGATVVNSAGGHMEYGFEWNALTSVEAAQIRDVLNGVYDTDENHGLIYFIDPAANRRNLFSEMWARPALCAALGTPSLTKGVRPDVVATGANSLRLPPRSAQFTLAGDEVMNAFYTPIPPGYTAHFAFYGPTAQTDRIVALPYDGEGQGTPVEHDILANTDYGTGFTSLSAGAGVTGVEFYLASTPGTTTLTAAILQIIPTGETPVAPVVWAAGGGHSGCKRSDNPDQALISVPFDNQTLSANFVEQGSWL